MSEKIKEKVVYTNLFWSFCERFGSHFVSTIISIILARILMPDDYGVISAITIFTGIATTFVTGGFSSALIQKKDAQDIDFSSMFFFNVFFSTILYVALFFFSPLLVRIFNTSYDYNLLSQTLRVSGIGIFLASINSFFRAILSKKLQFKKMFFISFAGSCTSGLVGIVLAISNFGVWALVFQNLGAYLMNCVLFLVFSKYKLSFKFSFKRLFPLVSFGSKLMLSSLITTLYMDVYGVVIGHEYDSSTLAYYNKGGQFPKLIVANLVGAINSALFPIMAKMNTKDEYKSCVKKMNTLSCFIILPLVFGLASVSNNFISALLTDKWLPAAIFLQIACFDYALQPVGLANLQAWKADGKGNLYLAADIVKKIFGISFIALSLILKLGVIGIAVSALLTTFVSFLINLIPGKKILNYSIFEQILDVLPYFILAFGMYAFVYGLGNFLNFNSVVSLLIQIVSGVLFYILGSLTLSFPEITLLKKMMFKIRNNLTKRKETLNGN